MKSVGARLALLVVVFPILLVVALSVGVIYLFSPDLEASVIVEIMSTLLSVVLVDLLVWERLRESLSGKLNYFHDNYLSELHESIKRGSILYSYIPTAERINPLLKRYGKFMAFSLYPANLPSMLGRFLILCEEFKKRFEKIESIGKELCEGKLNIYLWCHVLDIGPWEGALWKQNKPMFQFHEEKAQLIKKKQSKIILEAKEYLERKKKLHQEIVERLEDFFRSNSLEFKSVT